MAFFGLRLAHAEAEGVAILQQGVREIDLAALIQLFEQLAVQRIAADVPEANEIERHRRGQFETVGGLYPRSELLGQRDVLPNVVRRTAGAVVTDNKRQLRRTETPA